MYLIQLRIQIQVNRVVATVMATLLATPGGMLSCSWLQALKAALATPLTLSWCWLAVVVAVSDASAHEP